MLFKCPNEQLSIPDTYSAMRKGCTSQLTRKRSLYTRDLVLYILRLLTERSSSAIWADTLNRITDTFYVADQSF